MENGFEIEIHILDIPIHILSEIMIKLPAVSIVRCGSVCTKFRSIITDSSFQQTYFSRAPISCVVLSDHHHLSCIADQTQTLPSNHGSSCMAAMQAPPSKRRNRNSNSPIHQLRQGQQLRWNFQSINRRSRFVTFHTHRRMNLVNSSHGLLCLRSGSSATNYHHRANANANANTRSNTHLVSLYYICNPLLGEILSVPPSPTAPNDEKEKVCFSAFGFDPNNKQYKILQLVWKSDQEQMVAELYRLGDKDWSSTVIEMSGGDRDDRRSSSSSFSVKPKDNSSFDPAVNGALHWVTDSNRASELICSFDLNRNKFKWVAPPPHFDDGSDQYYVNKLSGMSVGVLKGCLCLCYVSGGGRFETWSMDNYGVKESWRKVFSIDIKSYCGLRPQDKHRPIGFNSCGDMWLTADSDSHAHSKCLVSFSAETGVFRHIDIGGVASTIQATPLVLSYVSLKDMLNLPATATATATATGNTATTHLKLQTLRTDKNYAFGLNVVFPV